MALYTFGGGTADVTTSASGDTTGGVQLTVWSARVGGVQVTDLYEPDGTTPLPGYVTSTVSADPQARGRVLFKAPDAYSALFLWDGNPDHDRWGVLAVEATTLIKTAIDKADLSYSQTQALADSLSALSGTVARLPSAELDVTSTVPTFALELFPVNGNNVMQSAVKDYATGDWFLAQVKADQDGSGADEATVSRIGPDGSFLDVMTLLDAGHGTKFGLQNIDGVLHLWWGWDAAPTNPANGAAKDAVRFPYVAGVTIDRDDPSIEVMSKFGFAGNPQPGVDEQLGLVVYRQIGVPAGSDTYTLHRLADVESDTYDPLGTVQASAATTVQGFAFDETHFFLYHGTSPDAQNPSPAVLEVWDWATGEQTGTVDMEQVGRNPDGSLIGGHHEPESLTMYVDPASGAKTLYAGMVVGPSGGRRNLLYAFSAVTAPDPAAVTVQRVAANAPVVQGGLCRAVPASATSMLGLTTPGDYHIPPAQWPSMGADRPADATGSAGFFLHVSGNGLIGRTEVIQTLTRSAIGSDAQQWWRTVRDDGYSPWFRVTATEVAYSA